METLEKLALWIGWAPIALVEFLFMLAAKFFYDRELSNKETTIQQLNFNIQKLNGELENSKQYQVDILVRSLSERVNIANQEIERLSNDKNSSHDELTKRKHELLIAQNEILSLREKLQKFEGELDDLLEFDYCDICDPDEDHPGGNYIDWGSAVYPLTGQEELVEKVGSCNYCNSPQIKCNVCGSVTSINLDDFEKVECAGECGVMYQIVVNYREHDYEIEISREDD